MEKNKNCKERGCEVSCCADLLAQLGVPDSNASFYSSLTHIIDNRIPIAGATEVVIPNTFFVGAEVPGTPYGPTLLDALTYIGTLPAPPSLDSPFQIIVTPGIYGVTDELLTLPSNVNLVALQAGTATIVSDIAYSDAGSTSSRNLIEGITLQGDVDVDVSTKTGGTSSLYFQNVTLTALSFSGRDSTEANPSLDRLIISRSTISGPVTLDGGLVEVNNSTVQGGDWVLPERATSLSTKLQVRASVFRPATLIVDMNFLSVIASILGGAWIVTGDEAFAYIQGSTVSGPTPSQWSLNSAAGAQVTIKNTELNTIITQTDPGIWNVDQPNLIFGGGTVDRDMQIPLMPMPNIGVNPIFINLLIALTSPPYQLAGPLPYTQPPLTTLQVSATDINVSVNAASTATQIVLNNLTQVPDAGYLSIMSPTPARILWY